MGLDMYLEGSIYLWRHGKDKGALQDKIKKACSHVKFEPTGVRFEIGYWRKCNAVHNWFVQNAQHGVDDCRKAYINKEMLEELIDDCKKAIGGDKDVLEPVSGFFFGNTDRDEYYLEDLKRTIEICKGAIKFMEEEMADVYYSSSW